MAQRLKKFYLENVFPLLAVESFALRKPPFVDSNPSIESGSKIAGFDQQNQPTSPTKRNIQEIPKCVKVVINRGLGEASFNTKLVEVSLDELTLISGQKTKVTKARKSVAGFKIREDMPVGISVTLRGDRMYAFLDRLMNLALPRIRDFQGIKPNFDGNGNLSFGLKEQLMFPEVEFEKIDKARGMDITICTSAQNDQDAFLLLKALGMPFTEALKQK